MVDTWFKILLSAFIPIVAAFFLPRGVRIYFVGTGLVMLVLAIITLVRQERRRPASSPKVERPPEDSWQ
jgi:hypothetical protein